MLRNTTFSTRIAASFGVLFSVATVVAVSLWYFGFAPMGVPGARESRLEAATSVLEYSANQQVASIRASLLDRRGDVLVLSESKVMADNLVQQDLEALQVNIDRLYERLIRAYPGAYQSLRLIDPESGRILASTLKGEVESLFLQHELLNKAAQPGMLELVEEVPGLQGQTLAILRQVTGLDTNGYPLGSVRGVLMATLESGGLGLAGLGDPRAGHESPGVTLVLGTGNTLMARFPAGDEPPDAAWRQSLMPAGFEGALQLGDGPEGRVLAVYRHIPLSGDHSWALVHYQAEADVFAGLQAQLRAVVLAAGLTALAALVLIFLSTRHLTRPLRRLADAARWLGDGELSTRAVAEHGDSREFVDLAEVFNSMADSVEHTQLHLEATVAERTQDLALEEERLRLAVAAGNVGIYDLNIATQVTTVNAQYVQMLGLDPETFVETDAAWRERLHPEDRESAFAVYQQAVNGTLNEYESEYRQRTPSGEWMWCLSKGRIIEWDAGGRPRRMIGTRTDITLRKSVELRLQLAANVFSHACEGIVIADAQGLVVDINATFTEITGYSREEAIGQNPRVLLNSGRQSDEFYAERLKQLNQTGAWSGEVWNRRKNGEVYPEMLTISAVQDAHGEVQNYVALFTDITAMKAHQNQLEHIAHYDALTNLPNRLLLADRLHQSMAQCQRSQQSLGVAFLDLDGFKAVNDQYGHDLGDQLLVALAQRMKSALRDGDTLARLGGDEFVAVLVGLENPHDCEPVLERLLRAAADPVQLGSIELQVSASVGVTIYPQDGADADMLLRHADQAMYVAKQSGKNRFHLFDVAHDVAVKSQLESVDQIQRALAFGELVLFYQPKVNMRTGDVVGAEALIRWQHPERGLLAPGLFLPAIEEHPVSIEVGTWVIATALHQMEQWQALGLQLPVSVNVGARQLQHAGFTAALGELLAAHPAVSPQNLELEVLETSALADVTHVSGVMLACKTLGARFALDDFGTGYSSLTYLKLLPAETIKIDRSFVLDMLGDTDDLAIVQSVVGLAKAFRRNVIAEGVETIAHGELLLQLGCEFAQGFAIARPMPASEMPGWIAQWRPDPAWTVPLHRPVSENLI